MPRITDQTREHNEAAIRDAMNRLLRGDIPPGGGCDLKTLAAEAGVVRTGFYPKKDRDGRERPGPYQHLAEEFERRRTAMQDAGQVPDPKAAQIVRLKEENAALKKRIAARDSEVGELTAFKTLAVSRLAAQHEEILRLRKLAADRPDNVRVLQPRDGGERPSRR